MQATGPSSTLLAWLRRRCDDQHDYLQPPEQRRWSLHIDGNSGVVTVAGAINREADGPSRNITIRATSADGSFTDQVFSIAIVDANEFAVTAPTDTDATTNAVDENVVIGTVVGITASSSDSDATTNTVTYSLFDNDGGNFTIDANTGVVTTAAALNRETLGASRNITIRATSADGSTADTVFTININDLDEFNVGAVTDNNGTANTIVENAANGTLVNITVWPAMPMPRPIRSRTAWMTMLVVDLPSMRTAAW